MIDNKELTIIGRAERITLPDFNLNDIPAKVDTGADASSIWANNVKLKEDGLYVIFFAPESEYYTGLVHIFPKTTYSITRVANSFGHKEIRYKVKLKVRIKKRVVKATFTLSDRSQKLYPILIGRKLLNGKFLVDVQRGKPLREAEQKRKEQLLSDINALGDKI